MSEKKGFVCLVTDMTIAGNSKDVDISKIPYHKGDLIVMSPRMANQGYADMVSFNALAEYTIEFAKLGTLDEFRHDPQKKSSFIAMAKALKEARGE